MTDKYRVHELAKDLGAQSKDVLEVLNQHLPNSERKYQTALNEKELNLVLDHFTKQQQVEDVNQYFAAKHQKPEAPKAAAPKAEAQPAQNAAQPAQNVAQSAQNVAQPAQNQAKPAAPAQEEAKPAAPAAQTQTERKPAAGGERRPYNNNEGGERRTYNNDRRPYNNDNRPAGEARPYNNNTQSGERRSYNNNNEGGERRPYNNDRRPYNNDNRPAGEARPYNNNNTQSGERRPYNNNNEGGERRPYNNDRRPYNNDNRPAGEARPYNNNNTQSGERRPYNNNNEGGERRPYTPNPQSGERRPYTPNTAGGERRPYNNDNRPAGEARPYNNNTQGGERRPYNNNEGGERRPYTPNPQSGERRPYTPNTAGGSRPYNNDNRPAGESRPYNNTQGGERRPYTPNTTGGSRPYNNDRRPYSNDRVFDKDKDSNQKVYNTVKSMPRPPRPAVTPAVPREPLPPGTAKGGARHVDMRTSNVDLEKYNEKYEQIATETAKTVKDTAPKKQKFGQKSNRKPVLSRKEMEAEKMRRLEMERQRRQKLEITLPEEISVGDLALKLKVQGAEIVKRLMTMGVMASVSQIIDYDTAALVAIEIGAKVEREVVITIEDRLFNAEEDTNENLQPRCPVVVVMGHVDHGKTSLLDAIRSTEVTAGEAGGITQHIGAYQVEINGQPITFLDTPGHAAFTSMRARGAQVTDIAVLVVAADDGIMPQTVEAINHAKAADVSIIVAINKVDKPTANVEKIKQELTEHGLVAEEWGGDTICVPISAKTKFGIDDLLENILLVAEVKELKANPDRLAKGTVIEAKLDKGRGPVATVLVQNGTLRTGDIVIAGTSVGRVRVMLDDKGNRIEEAGPSTPVEVTGLSEVPTAGDVLNAVEDERLAKELVDQRRQEAKEEQFKAYQKVTLDNLFSQISQGDIKELPVIVKADVNGSVEAVKQSLEKLSNSEVRVRVIHGGVGAVSESDVMLANASNAIIVGFNVRPDPLARESAERDDVEIRLYRIIYDAINEIESAMKGMLAPKYRDVDLGRAEVRAVYKITNAGTVAGCYVLDGKIARNANIRIVRDGIIVADDKLDSLKRFKDDVKEVATGYECGMSLLKFKDIKEGDIFEAYIVEEYRD